MTAGHGHLLASRSSDVHAPNPVACTCIDGGNVLGILSVDNSIRHRWSRKGGISETVGRGPRLACQRMR
jgi:hypothetical protein